VSIQTVLFARFLNTSITELRHKPYVISSGSLSPYSPELSRPGDYTTLYPLCSGTPNHFNCCEDYNPSEQLFLSFSHIHTTVKNKPTPSSNSKKTRRVEFQLTAHVPCHVIPLKAGLRTDCQQTSLQWQTPPFQRVLSSPALPPRTASVPPRGDGIMQKRCHCNAFYYALPDYANSDSMEPLCFLPLLFPSPHTFLCC